MIRGMLTRGRVTALAVGATMLVVGVLLFLLATADGLKLVGYLLALVGALVLLAMLLTLPARHIWLGLPASRWILRGGLATGFALIAVIVEPSPMKVLLWAVAALQVMQALLYVRAWRTGIRQKAGAGGSTEGGTREYTPVEQRPA